MRCCSSVRKLQQRLFLLAARSSLFKGIVISSINQVGEESRALSLIAFKCFLFNLLPVDPVLRSSQVSLS